MAKLLGNLEGNWNKPSRDPLSNVDKRLKRKGGGRSAGVHINRAKGDVLTLQSNPRPHPLSDAQTAWVYDFACWAGWTKRPWSGDFNEANDWVDGTGWYWRDAIHAGAHGNLWLGPGEIKITTPTARVSNTAFESLTNGVGKYLTNDTEHWDTNAFWNQVANQSRLTFHTPGVYLVGGTVRYTGVSGGRRECGLVVNRTDFFGENFVPASNTEILAVTCVSVWYFAKDDYVELWARANANGVTARSQALWVVAITPEAVVANG